MNDIQKAKTIAWYKEHVKRHFYFWNWIFYSFLCTTLAFIKERYYFWMENLTIKSLYLIPFNQNTYKILTTWCPEYWAEATGKEKSTIWKINLKSTFKSKVKALKKKGVRLKRYGPICIFVYTPLEPSKGVTI